MKWKLIKGIIFLSCLAFLFAGCQKKHTAKKDVDSIINKSILLAEKKSDKGNTDDTMKPTPKVTYISGGLRDPFELPELVKNKKQYPNTILPDQSLDSLKVIGIIMQDGEEWAIVRTSKGETMKLTKGIRVGLQSALLTKIEPEQVIFMEEVEMGSGLKARRIVLRVQEAKK